MIERIKAKKELRTLLKQFPAVALLGARQTGKTTLAKQSFPALTKKAKYFDLEKNSDRYRFGDMQTLLEENKDNFVIIDEAQTLPDIFTALRPAIDEKREPGRFLLLGSVSPNIVRGISETLAGRIAYMELGPINIIEALLAKKDVEYLWFRGGYPEAFLLSNDEQWYLWHENYFRSFVGRDVNLLMNESLSPVLVGKLWQMLSGINGSILNYEMLSRSMAINRATLIRYLNFLEGSFIIRRLQPWHYNSTKRVVKSPKIYFRDTGMLHYLQRISNLSDLKANIIAGLSWEGFVLEQVSQLKPQALDIYYYRTHHGAETDIVLVKGNKPVSAVEIKLSNSPDLTRGWYEVQEDLKTLNNFVITPNSDDFMLNKTTRVCSLEAFVKKHLPLIK